ncbi:MAG: tetratricopeptide repeat protein [Planctomycetota bacterium]
MRRTRRGAGRRRGGASRTLLAVCALAVAAGAGFFAAAHLRPSSPEAAEEAPSQPVSRPVASPERRPVPEERPSPTPVDADNARWIERNNEARDLLEAGELERAVELFAACYAARPDNDVFRRNLAEALFRLATSLHERGELERAVETLARSVETAPERDELAALLERWRRELELALGDTYAPGNYFRIEYDGQRRDLQRHDQEVIDFLEGGGRYREGAYETLRGFFGIDPVIDGGERIRVVLYDRAEFDTLTGLGDWAGGVFDGVIRVAVDDLSTERGRWERILRHELVHAFVRELGGRDVPGWLNEGLAQLLEVEKPSVNLARGELVGAPLFALDALRESLSTWKDPQEISRAYAQSLTLVAMIREQHGDAVLVQLLRGCSAGQSVEESFRAATGGVALSTVLLDLELELAGIK